MSYSRALLVTTFLLLGGCKSIGNTVGGWIHGNPPRTPLSQLTVSTDVAANVGNATMLDIVFVYDPAAVAQLPKTGPEWFARKAALQNMLATAIDVVYLQVPAGSADFSVSLPKRASDAIGVYVLANYLSVDGQVIANITPWKQVRIRLLPTTIQYGGS